MKAGINDPLMTKRLRSLRYERDRLQKRIYKLIKRVQNLQAKGKPASGQIRQLDNLKKSLDTVIAVIQSTKIEGDV